jgi:hypothetical protein
MTDIIQQFRARLAASEKAQLAAIAAGKGHLFGREPEAAPPAGDPVYNRFFGAPSKPAAGVNHSLDHLFGGRRT